jgi:type IV pilus assembly protein PilV
MSKAAAGSSLVKHPGREPAEKGFTLIEALVALLVLSIGLLGVAGLQMVGLRGNLSAASRTQANYLADDIIDRMRANYTAARRGDYNVARGATLTGATPAAQDVQAWVAELQLLPSAKGAIAVNATTNIATVTIDWVDSRGGDTSLCSGANFLNCSNLAFSTSTQL